MAARGQKGVHTEEEDNHDLAPADVARLFASADRAIDVADALILEDYNKGVLVPAVIERVMARASARKIPVVVDPKYRNFFVYRGATVFKPNRRELESALGAEVDLGHPDALPAALAQLGVERLPLP